MLSLNKIKDDVEKTAKIISSVINLQVIICDENRYIIGDSHSEDYKIQRVGKNSILAQSMEKKETIILYEKEQNSQCSSCPYFNKCDIKAIIGLSITHKNQLIGGIEVLANTEERKLTLIKESSKFISFINEMSSLLITKLLEIENKEELLVLKERLTNIIDSIDYGIIATDNIGQIIFYNSIIENFFDIKSIEKNNISNLINSKFIEVLFNKSKSFKNREIKLNTDNNTIYALISGKSIIMNGRNIGTVISIKKSLDVYNEINEISNPSIEINFNDIIGNSPKLSEVKMKASQIANSKSSVLITGESGTGKEVFARAIHGVSDIRKNPFITINCAAIPDNLLESELFGYEDGAFTGAKKGGKIGKFQLADGGTIFLDEIGEMNLHLQAKMLRIIQEKTIEKIGGSESIPVNIRIIAATNRNLETMVKTGEFREDLYYRLNVIPIHIPPLRERREDIIPLSNYFLEIYSKKLNKNITDLTLDVKEIFLNYKWHGNVRELQNIVEYGVNLSRTEHLKIEDLPDRIKKQPIQRIKNEDYKIETIEKTTKNKIIDALNFYGTDLKGKTMAAKSLGICRATLYKKIKKYDIKL